MHDDYGSSYLCTPRWRQDYRRKLKSNSSFACGTAVSSARIRIFIHAAPNSQSRPFKITSFNLRRQWVQERSYYWKENIGIEIIIVIRTIWFHTILCTFDDNKFFKNLILHVHARFFFFSWKILIIKFNIHRYTLQNKFFIFF